MPAKKKRTSASKTPVKKTPVEVTPEVLSPSPVPDQAVIAPSSQPPQTTSPQNATPEVPASEPTPTESESDGNALEEAVLADNPQESDLDIHNRTIYWMSVIVAVGIVIIALIVGSAAVGMPQNETMKKKPVAMATVTPTPTPTTPTRSEITFEVLNASGVAGAAGKKAESLRSAGYTVVTTGNATKQKATEIFLAESLTSQASVMVLGDMQGLLGVSSSSGVLTDSTASARIVLGSE